MSNVVTTIIRNNETLSGDGRPFIANGVDDVFHLRGDNCCLSNTVVDDDTDSEKPHYDAAQVIPEGIEPNAQYFGAISDNVCVDGFTVNGGNSMIQGITCFDGGLSRISVTGCTINSASQHKILLAGVLSGSFFDNNCDVVLTKMRIGGGHARSFLVKSFKDHGYAPVESNHYIEDRRFGGTGVDNFDLNLFRQLSEDIEWVSFEQHFNEVLDEYQAITNASVIHTESLSSVIASHEGIYTSFNRGRAGDAGFAVAPDLTIGAFIRRGELPFGHPKRIHAIGKYQTITQTLIEVVNKGFADENEKLTPKVQERIFVEYLLTHKRRSVYKFVTTGVRIDKAMLDLSKEWASIANPKTGQSYYVKRNSSDKAHTSIDAIRVALNHARDGFIMYTDRGYSSRVAFTKSVYYDGSKNV